MEIKNIDNSGAFYWHKRTKVLDLGTGTGVLPRNMFCCNN